MSEHMQWQASDVGVGNAVEKLENCWNVGNIDSTVADNQVVDEGGVGTFQIVQEETIDNDYASNCNDAEHHDADT